MVIGMLSARVRCRPCVCSSWTQPRWRRARGFPALVLQPL